MNDNQEQFSTGSVRDTSSGKLRYDLIPPFLLAEFAQHYTTGAEKYSDRNWEKGQPLTRIYASLMRHIQAWANGQTDENHLMAVAWNAFAIRFTEEGIKNGTLPEELDDRPEYMKPKACDDNEYSNPWFNQSFLSSGDRIGPTGIKGHRDPVGVSKCDTCIHQPEDKTDDCGFDCDDDNDCYEKKTCTNCGNVKFNKDGIRSGCVFGCSYNNKWKPKQKITQVLDNQSEM